MESILGLNQSTRRVHNTAVGVEVCLRTNQNIKYAPMMRILRRGISVSVTLFEIFVLTSGFWPRLAPDRCAHPSITCRALSSTPPPPLAALLLL